MKPTVLLFDVDGTLVTTGGVGRRAIELTFGEAYGRRDACSGVRFDGMTDRAIMRRGLEALGLEPAAERIDALLNVYVTVLETQIAAATITSYRIHDGIREALDRAGTTQNVAVGLGTGNIREGARLKLSAVDLYRHFKFGGFGCDHEDRVELIRVGAQRGAAQLGLSQSECRVVVIGDTPKDVAAAKGIGAECIGVGTGSYTPEELRGHGADYAFKNLAEPGALEALL